MGFDFYGRHPIELIIGLYKNLYIFKDTGLSWFENLKEVLDPIGFVKYQMEPWIWYINDSFLLLFVYNGLMFSYLVYN